VRVVSFPQGIAIHGEFPNLEVVEVIQSYLGEEKVSLSIVDPPYGNIVPNGWDHEIQDAKEFAKWMVSWTKVIGTFLQDNAALYVWGGTGKPRFRPFYRYLVEVEEDTEFLVVDHITWKKKRAYGIQWGYLYTREEVAYLLKGTNIKKPRQFNVPLLEEKRAYSGFNPKYPAKSEFYRRSNVWTDITEILRGKTHVAQKPTRLFEIPIEVHTSPGEIVLDTFAGSGTLGKAAINLGRRFILVEKDPIEFEKMVSDLSQYKPVSV
jgi:site-specific DNA-methyltransferase (adenine-specific)